MEASAKTPAADNFASNGGWTVVLEALGCSVLTVNEHARREALKPTMFFMPHCDAQLYNNLLHANWKSNLLNNVVILGNSFETYEHHASIWKTINKNSSYHKSFEHILAVRRFTNEFRIETVSDDYYNAFDTTSWHFFSPETEPHDINFLCRLPEWCKIV